MDLIEIFKVEKSNVLNEVRRNNMSLQELRFFSIYLAKINARDITSRVVTFPLEDFRRIMDFGRLNKSQIDNSITRLLQHVIKIPNDDGSAGYTSFQLFKECKLYQDNLHQWQVEIDAHDKALPLMFNIKNYVSYELWNALRLTSANQLRIYELLKQYEKAKERKIDLVSLKEFLGLNKDDYPRWSNFKNRVLDSCQVALKKNTDICFTYEPIKVGRKFTGVHFFISKNQNYIDTLSLDDFIGLKNIDADSSDDQITFDSLENSSISFLSEACNNEFSEKEMDHIFQLICQVQFDSKEDINIARYHMLAEKYSKLNLADERATTSGKPIKNRFAYFSKIIIT